MCCVLEAMPRCVVRLYCVRELQPHYISVYGIGSLTSRSFSALRGRAGRGHEKAAVRYWHRKVHIGEATLLLLGTAGGGGTLGRD